MIRALRRWFTRTDVRLEPRTISGREVAYTDGYSLLELERAGITQAQAVAAGLTVDRGRTSALGSNVLQLEKLRRVRGLDRLDRRVSRPPLRWPGNRLSSRAMNSSRWALLLIVFMTTLVRAQIPVTKEPHHHVVFENAQFRIMDVNVPAGESTLDHSHDRDVVTVAMSNSAEVRTQETGQQWANRPRRPVGDVETTEYAGKVSTHKFETMGTTAYQLFAVENMKPSGWSTTPAATGAGTTLAKESRSFRVYNVVLGKDRQQTSHTHAVPTIVVLLGGKVMSEGPDEKAKANAPAPVGLKQIDRPGQWLLVPAGDAHHLVRLGTEEGKIVEIEVR